MFEAREYFNNRFFQILISDEIINNSYPNTNYSYLVRSNFNLNINQIKKYFRSQLEELLLYSKNPLFINAHGGEKNNSWVIYDNEFNYYEINDFITQQIKEYKIDSCILYSCNPKNIKPNISSIPILYPNQKISTFIKKDETLTLLNKRNKF